MDARKRHPSGFGISNMRHIRYSVHHIDRYENTYFVKISINVTTQPGLRIYCADRTKTKRLEASGLLPFFPSDASRKKPPRKSAPISKQDTAESIWRP